MGAKINLIFGGKLLGGCNSCGKISRAAAEALI